MTEVVKRGNEIKHPPAEGKKLPAATSKAKITALRNPTMAEHVKVTRNSKAAKKWRQKHRKFPEMVREDI
jgi:hypothetical protein